MKKISEQDLIEKKEYLISLIEKPNFCGRFTYVGKDELNHIFISPKSLSRKITELSIPKNGIFIDYNKEIPIILCNGNECYLNICNLYKDRKRFFELTEKTGILIKNQ